MNRIDKLVIPAGLIRRARTYSLIADQGQLYVINTGRASRDVRVSANALARAMVDSIKDKFAREVQEGEEKINRMSLNDLVKEKHNIQMHLSEISEVKVGLKMYYQPAMILVTSKGKFKFICSNRECYDELQEFAKSLGYQIKPL